MRHVGIWSGVGLVLLAGVAVAAAQDKPRADAPPETPPAPPSASGTYRLDPVHSSNVFRIKHLNVANFYGRFNEMSGTFTLDDAAPENSRFEVTIKTASVDTNHPDRDKHVRSAEFFDVEKYPEMTFRSKAVKSAGENLLDVSGELTFRGVTRPLDVRIERTGSGPGLRGEFRAGFETTFTIKRSDFGMTALLTGLSDEVRITVSVEGVRQ